MRYVYAALGLFFFALGAVGALLPVLPTQLQAAQRLVRGHEAV